MALAGLALLFAACGARGAAEEDGQAASAESGEITVFAASSLSESFQELARSFERNNPRTHVNLNFASSAALAVQVNEGAAADVFAAADQQTMATVSSRGNVEGAKDFALNTPVIVVPRDGRAVQSLQDFAKPGVRIVLAAGEVPIGRYSREILAKASSPVGLGGDFASSALANVKSNEPNVRAVLTRVQLGEVDAGIVYLTDISSAGKDVRAIGIPDQFNVVARYPIAVVSASRRPNTARAFQSYVLSAEGQAILARYGFRQPGS